MLTVNSPPPPFVRSFVISTSSRGEELSHGKVGFGAESETALPANGIGGHGGRISNLIRSVFDDRVHPNVN
jgi:hypothetical protein